MTLFTPSLSPLDLQQIVFAFRVYLVSFFQGPWHPPDHFQPIQLLSAWLRPPQYIWHQAD
ncbi:UNVERIFIED_CONTAM: hypothetical protein Sangu_3254300 [Sesamum angustifolium]|uniref:Uncharacterized protein n=1 Tax=Sesamum angustifolium TaxID=2727405 RepID=A0AAW2JD61_9LAMI